MRKWKIRTKMIAGLCMLAAVILMLVYSSYSQLARDRYVAAEVTLLGEEIQHAHELNEKAALLSRSYDRYLGLRQQVLQPKMIDSQEFDRYSLVWEEDTIKTSLDDLSVAFENYQKAIKLREGRPQKTKLLVDQNQQGQSLRQIGSLLKQARVNWSLRNELPSLFAFQIAVKRDQLAATDEMNGTLESLRDASHAHFEKIQHAMESFQESVVSEQRAKRNIFLFCTLASSFCIAFLAWEFYSLIVAPFQTLFRGSQLIAAGHHQHKILLGTDDEIGLMADTVNDITDRFNQAMKRVTAAKQQAEQEVRDRTREVIQNEQLASVGFLAAGVAHEINNPLGAIAWGAEALEETLNELSDEQRQSFDQDFLAELTTNLGLIQSEAFRCKGITKRLLNFSRLSDSTRDQENVGTLVERVVSMVAKVGEYRCKTISTDINEGVFAYCNSQEIQQVILNLVSNALESVDTDGHVGVSVSTEIDPLTGDEEAVVTVEDDGCGMNGEVKAHLFEPFFTRRRDNTGTGLGLSISYRIVSLHHGSLTPYSDGEGRGSKLVLRLPTRRAEQAAVAPPTLPLDTNESSRSIKWNDVQKVA